MKANVEILQKALRELHDIDGISYAEITRESGVHNVGRIAEGKTTPTVQSWWKLNAAFPKAIPEPEFIRGEKVIKSNVFNSQTRSGQVSNAGRNIRVTQERNLSPDVEYLIQLINQLPDKDNYVRALISETIKKIDQQE